MSLRRNAGGVFWGLILVALGAVLLARNLGYDFPLWTGIATYWPTLLILWGGVKIVDYLRLRRPGAGGRLFSPGEVFLVILIVIAGTTLTATARLNPGVESLLEVANIDFFPLTGNEYTYTEHYESDAVAGANIEIINRFGGVEVRPDDVDRIVVDVTKTIIADTQEEADELEELLRFSIVDQASGYRIVSSFNRDSNRRGRRFRTSLSVRVPAAANVNIDNRNGPVTMNDLQGDQRLENAFGDVTVRGIDGSVRVDARNGDVTVENVTESATIDNAFARTTVREVGRGLELDTRNGDVTVESVGESAAIDNAFARTTVEGIGQDLEIDTRNGEVDVSGVGGNAIIENSFAAVEVSEVAGDLTIRGRNSSLDVSNVSGDVEVESAFQDIRMRDTMGELRITNRNGDVDVRLAEVPDDDIFVTTEFSSVNLDIPQDSRVGLNLSTRFGEIDSDFGGSVARDGPERSMTAQAAPGSPTIRIETRNGDIRINGN